MDSPVGPTSPPPLEEQTVGSPEDQSQAAVESGGLTEDMKRRIIKQASKHALICFVPQSINHTLKFYRLFRRLNIISAMKICPLTNTWYPWSRRTKKVSVSKFCGFCRSNDKGIEIGEIWWVEAGTSDRPRRRDVFVVRPHSGLRRPSHGLSVTHWLSNHSQLIPFSIPSNSLCCIG